MLVIRSWKTRLDRVVPQKLRLYGERPKWFPDGRSLLVDGWSEATGSGFFRVDTATGDARFVHGTGLGNRIFDLSRDSNREVLAIKTSNRADSADTFAAR